MWLVALGNDVGRSYVDLKFNLPPLIGRTTFISHPVRKKLKISVTASSFPKVMFHFQSSSQLINRYLPFPCVNDGCESNWIKQICSALSAVKCVWRRAYQPLVLVEKIDEMASSIPPSPHWMVVYSRTRPPGTRRPLVEWMYVVHPLNQQQPPTQLDSVLLQSVMESDGCIGVCTSLFSTKY